MFSLASLTRCCVVVFAITSTVLAIDGRTAVGLCIDSTASGARCSWSVSKDGSIDICNKHGCVTCPYRTSAGKVARKGRGRPTTALPPGTEVNTALGSFKIPMAMAGRTVTAAATDQTTAIPTATDGSTAIPTAMDGRTAVGRCIESTASGARCAWAVSKDGSIDICNKHGCVTC